MHIPTYLKREGVPLPKLKRDETRYIVADNGTFVERRTPIFSTSAKVPRYDLGLDYHEEYCRLNCGKITPVMHRVMLSFFQKAHELHGGEAALVLLYNPDLKRFRWHCPLQTIEMYHGFYGWTAADRIEFDNPLEVEEGYLHFGDAHLHPGPPNPSMVDINDDEDGLHIIVGNINKRISYNIDFVMDGSRFRVKPSMIFEAPDAQPSSFVPERWMKQIKIEKEKKSSFWDAKN